MSTPDEADQDFAAVLMQHAGGRAHTEASKKLTELIAAVTETGKKGSISVTLTVSRDKEMSRVVKIDDSIKANVPKETRRSLWFPDDNNRLHRNDPTQDSLFDEPAKKVQAPEGTDNR